MTLKEANKELERLENDYEYYLNEKEQLLLLVLPKATDIRLEKVDGGNRSDRLLEYAEREDEKKINETLDYIHAKIENLSNWIDNELKILGKYDEIEQLIVYYKEMEKRKYTWVEISQRVHYSVTQCRRIYRKYKKIRSID